MKAFFLTLIFAVSAHAYTVPETPPSAWNKGSFGVQTFSEYFSSSKNYQETRGSFDRLVNGNTWTSFENRIKLRYSPYENISVFGGIGAAAVSATNLSVTRTNSAVDEVYAGFDYLLARHWWRVVPEIEGSYPTDQGTKFQTNPLSSDGAAYANVGIFMFKPYRYVRFESYLGFHIPGDQLATRFMYNLGAELAMFGAFTLGGAIQGYESVISDSSTNADRQLTQAAADATSQRFRAFNPALLEAKAWIGLRFDRAFGVRLGYAKTLNGVRQAEGQSFLLSLYYNIPGNAGPRRGPPSVQIGPKTISGGGAGGDHFRTETEPNDPELFDQQKSDSSLDTTEKLFDH